MPSKLIRNIGQQRKVERVAASPSGQRLFTTTSDWVMTCWDLNRGKPLATATASDRISSVYPLSDDRTVVMIEYTGSLYFLRLQ